MRKNFSLFLLLLLPTVPAFAAVEHGTLVRVATLYVLPGGNAEKLMLVERGCDVVVLERTNMDTNDWRKVLVTIIQGESMREVTGWVTSKGVVTTLTPNGDQIIYGEAADSENQAEQRGGRKGAAQDAMRLYYRMWELFPNSSLAGEALWRSADIRWQLEKADIMSRPSSREMDPDARTPIEAHAMAEVEKKFPHTKWPDWAPYTMLTNHPCVACKGLPKCPENESDLYEHYVHEHPQSPKAAEG